jgi:hypothetical protein
LSGRVIFGRSLGPVDVAEALAVALVVGAALAVALVVGVALAVALVVGVALVVVVVVDAALAEALAAVVTVGFGIAKTGRCAAGVFSSPGKQCFSAPLSEIASQIFIPAGQSLASWQYFEQMPAAASAFVLRRHCPCWHSVGALQTVFGAAPEGLLHWFPAPSDFWRQTRSPPHSLSYVQLFVQMLPYVAHSEDSQSVPWTHASPKAFLLEVDLSMSQPAPADSIAPITPSTRYAKTFAPRCPLISTSSIPVENARGSYHNGADNAIRRAPRAPLSRAPPETIGGLPGGGLRGSAACRADPKR